MKLKDCPFCGGAAESLRKFDSESNICSVVGCKECWCSTYIYEDKKEAIKAWNRRE